MERPTTRRRLLGTVIGGASGVWIGVALHAAERGFQLHLWKKRGVFKNMVSRQYGANRSIPDKPIFSEMQLNAEEIAEIDFRFEALKPYLKPNPPHFNAAQK